MTDSDSNIVDVTPIGKEKPARLTKDVGTPTPERKGAAETLVAEARVWMTCVP